MTTTRAPPRVLFNSLEFFLFLPFVLLLYWSVTGTTARGYVLLGASLAFYASWYPPYLALLAGAVAVCHVCARWLGARRPRLAVGLAATALFALLGWYKYAAFLAHVLADLGLPSVDPARLPQTSALPLGISFIVFQGLGYVIDVARREKAAEPRYATVLLFKAYFPQLIAGPICRARELMPQFAAAHRFEHAAFASGLAILAVGLALKVVFADNVAPAVDRLFSESANLGQGGAWVATLGFGVQILADFWGYSTMAYGMSLMFGITLPVNFRLPYLARGLRDFWRRWHITLSQWLRDYLYIPLGGSRHGRLRTQIALIVTLALGGLWHGANYTFMLWGLLHGVALAVEHLVAGTLPAGDSAAGGAARVWRAGRAAFAWLYAMAVVFAGWVLFRAPDLATARSIFRALVVGNADSAPLPVGCLALIVAFLVLQVPLEALLARLRGRAVPIVACYALSTWLMLGAVVLSAPDAAPFIYFQF